MTKIELDIKVKDLTIFEYICKQENTNIYREIRDFIKNEIEKYRIRIMIQKIKNNIRKTREIKTPEVLI